MSLLTRALELQGITAENAPRNSTAGRVFGSEPVHEEQELLRIIALPRRRWQDTAVDLSAQLRKTSSAQLFPVQSAALRELELQHRVAVVAGLGVGKTHVSALAPTVVNAKRPLFLNYSRLMDKTRREFSRILDDWHACRNYEFLSVEALSREKQASIFERLEPDFICVDESNSLADPRGSRYKRLRRYLSERPEVGLLLLTGTPGTSLSAYAHLQELLHAQRSPLPRPGEFWHVLQAWCEATDTKTRGGRRPVGALVQLSSGDESLDAVRVGIGTRVEETAGNIYCRDAEELGFSLCLTAHKLDTIAADTDAFCLAALRDESLPDGRVFSEVYDKSLILKQLGCGFAKVLNPIPPKAWREARGLVASFVREIISQEARYRLDTSRQVVGAVRRGEIDDSGIYAAWRDIEPTFTPTYETVWFDTAATDYCKRWLAEQRGLLWTTFPTFGRKLAELTGLPFFHARGVDALTGRSIEEHPGDTGAILAVGPNAFGRNLQDRWHKNLYVSPPAGATLLDQSIGRTARRGQLEALVEVEFLLSVREHWLAVQSAREGSETDRTLGKNNSSRLLACDWLIPEAHVVNNWRGPRWER